MPLLTRGFATHEDLEEHFETHVTFQNEFPGIQTEQEYLELADKFLSEPLNNATTEQCQRIKKDGSKSDVVRYNRVTQEFGILSIGNVIRTYFIPTTIGSWRHTFPTNYDYYLWNCSRRK